MNKNTPLIILAGGKSSRMGFPKGLLKHNTTFWILSQIKSFVGKEIFIGLGFDYQLYFDAIPWLQDATQEYFLFKEKKIKVIINPNPEFGLFSTLQSVLKKVNKNQNILVIPIDVPLLNSIEQEKIILERNYIVIPTYKNKNGHPVKLSSKFWTPLLKLNVADENSRLDIQIKGRNTSEVSFVKTNDASILQNLNTPIDWKKFNSV